MSLIRHLTVGLFLGVLAGCSQPAPEVTVDYLLAHPEALKALQQQCRLARDTVSAQTCVTVSEAQHHRFWGNGKTRYTPGGGVSHE